MRQIQKALLSVYDKTGIIELAKSLVSQGVELLSTGGTFRLLQAHHVPVTEVSEYTGFPEIMDGRVKTLHPKIHGGILARREEDQAVMAEQGIEGIDMVVVNLYPFQETIAKPDCTLAKAIENIDIGGPTMIRAAAKNHAYVTVVTDPSDYSSLIQSLEANQGKLSEKMRFSLATKAFKHTAEYDANIYPYLEKIANPEATSAFPQHLHLSYIKQQDLRYGENPHQAAAFYAEHPAETSSITSANQIQGKALSYNNIADTDAALECVKSFSASPACVIVKHANPCGVAVGSTLKEAYQKAFATDPTSAFGGIIAFNRTLDADTAAAIIDNQFVEVIIAPDASEKAMAVCSTKPNVRLLVCGDLGMIPISRHEYKSIAGGLLVQDKDSLDYSEDQLQVVTQRQASEDEMKDLLFAWKVAKHVKSNAIVYAKAEQTIGVGAGQMSRVYSAKIAGIKAKDVGLRVSGSVMASDAFFPFRDGIDAAAEAGIKAVIQPGGSMRDAEVIAAADEHDMAMVFTSIRHFKH